jgi:hypothetical protein
LTSKSGPLNAHALLASYWDLENLSIELTDAIFTLGGPVLKTHMETNMSQIGLLKSIASKLLTKKERKNVQSSQCLRSTIRFGEAEMKLRVIAIGDYYSQTALRPLHDAITKMLKTIPQDQSFDQAEGLLDLSRASTLIKMKFYCFDLMAFTDTFPFELITNWIKFLYGSEYAEALKFIMVGLEYEVQGTNKKVRYLTGNPMGFYGSFVLTSLLHHYIFFECCRELGIPWSTALYKLLGDDVLIWDEELAKCYRRRLHAYNIKFSPLKTLIGSNLFEFAKRKFYLGHEVSPISYKSWLKSTGSIAELVEFNKQCNNRGAFTKGFCDNIVDYTCQSYQIMTGVSRPKDVRYFSNLINFEFLCLNNKSDNLNVGRIISAALASNSQLLPSTILETKESREILFRVFYQCMKKRLRTSISSWMGIDDSSFQLYIHTYLSSLGIPDSDISAFQENLLATHANTPIIENFVDLLTKVLKTLFFVMGEPEDYVDISACSDWYESTLQAECWSKRKSSMKKEDFRFDQSRIKFSRFIKLLRSDIREVVDKILLQQIVNTIPLAIIKMDT